MDYQATDRVQGMPSNRIEHRLLCRSLGVLKTVVTIGASTSTIRERRRKQMADPKRFVATLRNEPRWLCEFEPKTLVVQSLFSSPLHHHLATNAFKTRSCKPSP